MASKKWLGLILFFMFNTALADISQRPDVQAFIQEMSTQEGFSQTELTQLFKKVNINNNIIDFNESSCRKN